MPTDAHQNRFGQIAGQSLTSFSQGNLAQLLFAAHNGNNQDVFAFKPIKYPAGRNNHLSVGQVGNFLNSGAGLWEPRQTLDGCEYLLHIALGGIRFIEGNIVGNGL
jgi:hypothetical protein